MNRTHVCTLAVLAAVSLTHAGLTRAEAPESGETPRLGVAASGDLVAFPPDLSALQDRFCPVGEEPRSMSAGDAQSWTCGPWAVISAPEPSSEGRTVGWVVSYSGVVPSGQAEGIADVEKDCRAANATVTRQSETSIECHSVFGDNEQTMFYSKSTMTKAHVLFGMDWFETLQDRMNFTVTVRPTNGAVSAKS